VNEGRGLLRLALSLSVLGLVGCPVDEPDGASLYFSVCADCHAADGRGSDRGPDLTEAAVELSVDDIVTVVLDGEGLMNPQTLDAAEAEAVASFVLDTLVP
jgi:mono/diheme cytochrome c family protein